MLKRIKERLQETWAGIKTFFGSLSGYREAGTIVIARVTAAIGAWLLTIGTFDWSPVWNLFTVDTGFTWKQLLAVGGPILVGGIILEITRRRNAKDL